MTAKCDPMGEIFSPSSEMVFYFFSRGLHNKEEFEGRIYPYLYPIGPH